MTKTILFNEKRYKNHFIEAYYFKRGKTSGLYIPKRVYQINLFILKFCMKTFGLFGFNFLHITMVR